MSRAFVKENDLEHAGIDIPERPVSDEPNYVTPKGLALLNTHIDALEIERGLLKQKKDDPIAKQKIANIVGSIKEEEILSYKDYTSQCIDNGYISSDPELDYSNYLHVMRDTSSSSYHYEELSVLEQLGE